MFRKIFEGRHNYSHMIFGNASNVLPKRSAGGNTAQSSTMNIAFNHMASLFFYIKAFSAILSSLLLFSNLDHNWVSALLQICKVPRNYEISTNSSNFSIIKDIQRDRLK
uniref:Uncharacterized protein n=1 Tax=Glossina pallidipes TaxID=7398 RepID=A0A1B0A864_GLOPL